MSKHSEDLPICLEEKKEYDKAFNSWFKDVFLVKGGQMPQNVLDLFEKYNTCLMKNKHILHALTEAEVVRTKMEAAIKDIDK